MFDRILNSPLYQLFSQNYCLYVLMNLINIFHHISSNSVLRTIKSMWPYVQHICVITKIIIVFPNHVFLYGELKLDAKHMTKNEIKHKWSVSVSSEHIGKYAWIQPTLTPPKFLRTPSSTEHLRWLLRFSPCQKNIVCEWIQTLRETNHEIKANIFTCFWYWCWKNRGFLM